jgi:hypothetical protein
MFLNVFSYVRRKCFMWILHMFHTYVASILSGRYICLQWFFSRVSKCFVSVLGACCNCFSCFVRMLQMFYLNVSKVNQDIAHVAMWPPATVAYCSCLGAVHAREGTEGWSDARQWTRKAEGDGGRQAQRAPAESGGGRSQSGHRHEVGVRFHGSNSVMHRNWLQRLSRCRGASSAGFFYIYFYILLGSNPCMSIAV